MKTWKPYQLASMSRKPHSDYRRVVETISHPTPDGTIMVRMVPGEPTTMVEVPLRDLTPYQSTRYLHVARVFCRFVFPEDMLRYDSCSLYDHTVRETGGDGMGLKVSEEGLLIYRLSKTKLHHWTEARWASFSATVVPHATRDLKNVTDLSLTVLARS